MVVNMILVVLHARSFFFGRQHWLHSIRSWLYVTAGDFVMMQLVVSEQLSTPGICFTTTLD
jgi:hypothetical protein